MFNAPNKIASSSENVQNMLQELLGADYMATKSHVALIEKRRNLTPSNQDMKIAKQIARKSQKTISAQTPSVLR